MFTQTFEFTKKVDSLTWDKFENTLKQHEYIHGMESLDEFSIAMESFEDGCYADMVFVNGDEDSNSDLQFNFYDEHGNLIEMVGGMNTLEAGKIISFIREVDKTTCKVYVAHFVRGE